MARTRYPIWGKGPASVPLSPGTGRGARLHQPRSSADPTTWEPPRSAARGGGRDPPGGWSGGWENGPRARHRSGARRRGPGDQSHLHPDPRVRRPPAALPRRSVPAGGRRRRRGDWTRGVHLRRWRDRRRVARPRRRPPAGRPPHRPAQSHRRDQARAPADAARPALHPPRDPFQAGGVRVVTALGTLGTLDPWSTPTGEPPLILTFDTSSKTGGVALCRGFEVLGEETWVLGNNHTSQVLPAAARLCERAGYAVGEVRRVVTATGPGSFTGLR